MAQLGQDRGGFYSYAFLENLLGLGIRNADRIHPEWQDLGAGDTVYATPAGGLGLQQRFGWKVLRIEPGCVLGLENWGAFVLQRAGTNRTRFIIRTSGSGAGSWAAVVLAPMGLLVFEPAHFIMQRKMMAEVKRRAERGWAATAEETDPLVSTSAP